MFAAISRLDLKLSLLHAPVMSFCRTPMVNTLRGSHALKSQRPGTMTDQERR